MSLRSRHTKSTINGPIASCRTNLNPPSRRSRKANQSLRSASVCEPRSLRSILTFLRLGPRIAPHPARRFAARHPLPAWRGEGKGSAALSLPFAQLHAGFVPIGENDAGFLERLLNRFERPRLEFFARFEARDGAWRDLGHPGDVADADLQCRA